MIVKFLKLFPDLRINRCGLPGKVWAQEFNGGYSPRATKRLEFGSLRPRIDAKEHESLYGSRDNPSASFRVHPWLTYSPTHIDESKADSLHACLGPSHDGIDGRRRIDDSSRCTNLQCVLSFTNLRCKERSQRRLVIATSKTRTIDLSTIVNVAVGKDTQI